MDHLCELSNDRARRQALKSLPPDLPSIYERILERVNASGEENQIMVQRALRWIVCAEEPLSLAALAEAITINEGDKKLDRYAIPDEDAILRWCSSLVRRSVTSEGLELAHFTVKEFLLAIDPIKQNSFRAYGIQTVQCQGELAKTCLTYLCLEDFAGDCLKKWDDFEQRNIMYSFRRYAVCYWVVHAWATNEDEPLLELMKTLFEPVKSNQFISWTQEYVFNNTNLRHVDVEDRFARFACQTADSTLLHWAAQFALSAICRWLLNEGCDVNKPSEFLGSPLYCAVLGTKDFLDWRYSPNGPSKARDEVVKLLVEGGANVNYHFDCISNSISISVLLVTLTQDETAHTRARILLQAGAVIDEICIDYLAGGYGIDLRPQLNFVFDIAGHQNLQGEASARFVELALRFKRSPKGEILDKMKSDSTAEGEEFFLKYHFSTLLNAVKFGSIGSVRSLVSMYKGNLNVQRLSTLLYIAAAAGHADIIQVLIQNGADVHREDEEGQIPLHHAAGNGDLRSFLILVEKGSKIRQADRDGLTAAHVAATHDNLKILETLESTSDERLGLMSRAKDGQTPLLCAAHSGSLEVVKFILSRFSNVDVSECTEDGRSCLHLAARGGLIERGTEKLQFFVDQGLDVNQRTRDGSTSLHFAALRGQLCYEVIELLLTHGADPSALREDGCSVLHLLSQRQDTPDYMFAEIISLFSSPMEEMWLNAKAGDENGYTALHYCVSTVSRWNLEHLDVLLDHTEINVNALDNKQSTPLHLLIQTFRSKWSQDCCRCLQKLIGKGAAMNQDINGRTPLHDLCDITYPVVNEFLEEAVKNLLDHGADLTTEDANGRSTYTILLERLGKGINVPSDRWSTTDTECSVRMFTLILQYAAKPLPDTRSNGFSPLSLALQSRKEDLITTLLSFEPDVDQRGEDEFRSTPLEIACDSVAAHPWLKDWCHCPRDLPRNIMTE